MTAAARKRWMPWAGLIAAPIAVALHQQGFTSLLHFNCQLGTGGKGFLSFTVLALVLFASGSVSWRARSGEELQRCIATTSVLAAALALFAIALQTAATLILPGCAT